MNDEYNDDEIRESIPCVTMWVTETASYSANALCLPVGYSVDYKGTVWWRGIFVAADGGEAAAWTHAVAREKAKRQMHAQPGMSSRTRVAMMQRLARECDALYDKLKQMRYTQRWSIDGDVREKDSLGNFVLWSDINNIISDVVRDSDE